ncbi:hypothetical protein F53441_1212 [Fusarium austroafricanum]|uniref:Uncharacterized protein n=1 Tax=Fusarium austroafricanum TaxID=2364996 RepID=A0A8H4KUZ7_9HYPO|nr:hypothetical protein F53441_1212 [Fusarium austroafricanum]
MDWANDNAICCEHDFSTVFRYQERPTSVVRISPDGTKPLVWTMQDDLDWEKWFESKHPKLDGSQSGLVLIFSRQGDEPNMDPVKKAESNDWVRAIRKVTADVEHTGLATKKGPGGQRTLQNLPFSEQTFRKVAKKFHIHQSIIRAVSRADVSNFSAAKLEMGELNGHALPAYVYTTRTSNAWHGDLAISSTYFPHCGLTFAIMFGCTLSVEAEVLTRLENLTYEICHPLLMPGILVELERKRHKPIVEETINEIEARIQQLDEGPETLEGVAENEKVARKEAKRSAWLDMLYLRNQLISWNACLGILYKHTNSLSRTVFPDPYPSLPYTNKRTEEPGNDEGPLSNYDSDSGDSFNGRFLTDEPQDEKANPPDKDKIVSSELQPFSYQEATSLAISKLNMRRTSAKIRGRLREIIKDYNEYIRECTTGIEGMVMATQWAQGETNVEIALATSQDSRHMRSIALVTMIFLPGTFFASIFSMGFFEWKGVDGAVVVARSFWIYVVLAAGFTALTVGAWWYLGVYRHKRHRGVASGMGQKLPSKLTLLYQLPARKRE